MPAPTIVTVPPEVTVATPGALLVYVKAPPLLLVGAVRLNAASPKFLAGMESAPIVDEIGFTVRVAVVVRLVYPDVASCVAVIVALPPPTTFTSFVGRIDTPETQFDAVPVKAKLPFNVPVLPPLVLLFVTVVIPVFVPPAVPWLNRLYATSPLSLPTNIRR